MPSPEAKFSPENKVLAVGFFAGAVETIKASGAAAAGAIALEALAGELRNFQEQ